MRRPVVLKGHNGGERGGVGVPVWGATRRAGKGGPMRCRLWTARSGRLWPDSGGNGWRGARVRTWPDAERGGADRRAPATAWGDVRRGGPAADGWTPATVPGFKSPTWV
jgi:hypothetical protein